MGMFDFLRAKREADVQVIKRSFRSYAAANVGRLFSDFMASDSSADRELMSQLKVIRERCRDMARNDEYAARFLQLRERNVVGERGINLQMKARDPDGSLDDFANDSIEVAWRRWGKLGNPTVDGRMDWVDCQKYVERTMQRDGEAIAILVTNSDPDLPAVQLQFIEPDQLDEALNIRAKNGNQIRMGVEVDDAQRPVAYHFLSDHPGDHGYLKSAKREHIRVPAENVIHVFKQERVMQSRGVPSMHAALTGMKMLKGYREAELVAARVSASKIGFFTSPAGDGFLADDYDGSVPIMDAEPGSMHQLPQGVDFKSWDPEHPVSAYADFEKQILKGIASGLNVSYTSLANDLEGVSYSSIREGSLSDRDEYRVAQQFLITHFIRPVFERWLKVTLLQRRINLPSEKLDKWYDGAVFRGRGWQWVDPQKEMNAAIAGLKNGILSMQDVANQYGRDVEETFAQIAQDKALAERFGIKFALEPYGAMQMPIEPDVTGGE